MSAPRSVEFNLKGGNIVRGWTRRQIFARSHQRELGLRDDLIKVAGGKHHHVVGHGILLIVLILGGERGIPSEGDGNKQHTHEQGEQVELGHRERSLPLEAMIS